MTTRSVAGQSSFSPYQRFVTAILAIIQFTVILDFMVISPLGAILMNTLAISPAQFGWVVSVYAFSAAAAGVLAAGFADRFDRKRLLLFFYAGFMLGTAFCALAPDYQSLLMARVVTGLFGGVISSVSLAIVTDLFEMSLRGRVMGFVQMAFAASQVLGIPIGLLLANQFGWHAPFWLIAGVGTMIGIVIQLYMKPVDSHLKYRQDRNPFHHLIKTVGHRSYLLAFATTAVLTTGGFMVMPFSSAFSVNNVGLTLEQLPILYGITGVCSIVAGPLIGRWSDRIGKFTIFCGGSILTMITTAVYTNLGITPFVVVMAINIVLLIGISSRMISSSALLTAVPSLPDRGAFMSIIASVQQLAGGLASLVAGLVIVQQGNGPLQHFDTLGYMVIATMLGALYLMFLVDRQVRQHAAARPESEEAVVREIAVKA